MELELGGEERREMREMGREGRCDTTLLCYYHYLLLFKKLLLALPSHTFLLCLRMLYSVMELVNHDASAVWYLSAASKRGEGCRQYWSDVISTAEGWPPSMMHSSYVFR